MRSHKLVFGLALLSATTVLSSSFAQTPAAAPAAPAAVAGPPLVPPTVAVVDMQRVLRDSAAGRSIESQLESESRKFRDQVTQLQDQIKTGENDLRRQRAVMAEAAFNEQAQALERKRAEAQRTVQDRQEALQKGQGDAVNVVADNMKDIVQQIAVERHLGMVLSKQVVISFSDKNMDITDDVVQRLNTKLPTVAVTIPAPGSAAAPAAASATPAPVGPVKKK